MFQNCHGGSAIDSKAETESLSSEIDTDPAPVVPPEEQLRLAEARRNITWAKRQDPAGYWDIAYEADGNPSDPARSPYLWDNPMDDDWADPNYGFHWNTPSPGFLTVDRTKNASNPGQTGNIWRRDEFIDPKYGFTMELRVQILRQSLPNSFFIQFVNQVGVLSVLLSPNKIIGGSTVNAAVQGKQFEFDFDTTDFHTYRITVTPNSTEFKLFVDGVLKGRGTMGPTYKVGVLPYVDFPYVLIGDNSNHPSLNAAYVLDYVRYRRGRIEPGEPFSLANRREPPSTLPLPDKRTMGFYEALRATGIPDQDPGGVPGPNNSTCYEKFCLRGARDTWKIVNEPSAQNGKAVEIDGRSGRSTLSYLSSAPELINKGDLTVEFRIKMFSDADERSFTLHYMDQLGSVSVVLSPKAVEASQGLKPTGIQKYQIDLTDRFHTLRIVRKAGELYAQVYLNDNIVPIIADEHLDGTTGSQPSIQFGATGFPERGRKAHILLDYIRWKAEASAPVFR